MTAMPLAGPASGPSAPGGPARRRAGFGSALAAVLLVAFPLRLVDAQEPVAPGPEALAEAIAALVPKARPRAVLPWRTCVRTAFADARASGKPVLVWAFRGDPGEERC